jgi:hypothetical protein
MGLNISEFIINKDSFAHILLVPLWYNLWRPSEPQVMYLLLYFKGTRIGKDDKGSFEPEIARR